MRYEYQDENGEWQQFEDKKHFIDNQKWGEPTRALYTSPPKREPLSSKEIADFLDSKDEADFEISYDYERGFEDGGKICRE